MALVAKAEEVKEAVREEMRTEHASKVDVDVGLVVGVDVDVDLDVDIEVDVDLCDVDLCKGERGDEGGARQQGQLEDGSGVDARNSGSGSSVCLLINHTVLTFLTFAFVFIITNPIFVLATTIIMLIVITISIIILEVVSQRPNFRIIVNIH